ncbi:hypothetical protein RB195_013350 [Necator americanus]|uniref:Uncharacterized protein n=1 Tax=Necator americanus TaxID=51031 RepID=A0ABR1DVS7_NECAM
MALREGDGVKCSYGKIVKGKQRDRKTRNAITEIVTREYTIHTHKRTKEVGSKKRAPRAIENEAKIWYNLMLSTNFTPDIT